MTTGSRFAQLRRLFDEVCDLPPAQRRSHLRASGASADVIAEVEALIDSETRELRRVAAPVAAALAQLPETELDVGDRVGAWQLVEKLASGGMGAVYRAARADGHFEQEAAVKLLRGIPTEDALALLAAERQILAGLQHPHIARLLDGGATPGGQPYLVMEYVDGVTIDRWCAQRQLGLKARLRLFRNVCRAAAFAHQRLIVHCDLKPSNVLVRNDGSPVLLDFGIARALDRTRERASNAYTPGYASPEQMAGAPVSVASDVYSLGLILFELVSGRKARLDLDDATVAELTRAQRRPSDLADPQCAWRQHLRGDLDAIILRATALHPGLRYASADALAEDIERYLDLKPVDARAPTLRYRSGRLVRRRWPLFAAAAAMLVMAAGFSWRLVNERDRAVAAEQDARLQAETAEEVSDFLISIFEFANPEKNPGRRDISAREMLEESTRRVGGTLEDKPGVKARLLDVLGRTWDRLGQPQRAMALYADSTAQWLRAGGLERERAATLRKLAVVQANNGLLAAGEASALQALALQQQDPRHTPADLAENWNTLGVVYVAMGRNEQAQDYLERALAVRGSEGEAERNVTGRLATMHNLARLYSRQGRHEQSLALFRETLAGKRSAYGAEKHPSYVNSLQDYAAALGRARQFGEAVDAFRRALALQRELEGGASSNLARTTNELGSTLQDAGRYAEAMVEYREALDIFRASGETLTTALVLPMNNLAVALEETGDYAAAEPLSRESLALRRKALPDDAPAVLRGENNLARLLARAGKLDEARPLLEHALQIRRRDLGAQHEDTGRSLLLRAEWLRRAGKLDEAAAALAELDASGAKLQGGLLAQRERERARLALAQDQPQQALAPARQSYALLLQAYGATHPLAAAGALELAGVLHANGADAEARSLLAASRAAVEQTFVASSPERASLSALEQALR
jgi:eukaryotic-like serine/threonine-protein kinase